MHHFHKGIGSIFSSSFYPNQFDFFNPRFLVIDYECRKQRQGQAKWKLPSGH